MARNFFYVSLGILCLVAAFALGASTSNESLLIGVGPAAAGIVLESDVGIVSQWAEWMLDSNGDTWNVMHGCWTPEASTPLPVPIAELKFWHPTVLITKANVLWLEAGGTWNDCGAWPGGPISTGSQSWGQIKEAHR